MEDIDRFLPDEEEEFAEEEGANRTFIILVAALGGLLALAICAFVVWAVIIAPRMRADIQAENHAIQITNTAVSAAATETATAAVTPTATATETPAPTDTPQPTPTEPPTRTPTPAGAEEAAATAEPTATPRPTSTPTSNSEKVPSTGVGAMGGGVLALGLLVLLIVVRRLRKTA